MNELTLKEFLEYPLIDVGNFHLTPYHLVVVVLAYVIIRILLWSIKKLFQKETTKKRFDKGQRFALYQLIKYIIIIIAVTIVLENLGINITPLILGSTALLLGLGFALQHLFQDFISGIILLSEGTIKVDDVIEVDGIVGRVTSIGFRTSHLETTDSIIMILPNSKFTSEKVINWTHNRLNTRFTIEVGVAYGTDIELLKKTLNECIEEHSEINENSRPDILFKDFGDSALIFQLRFWHDNMFRIEVLKSELRFLIDKKFREKGIVIPFPQTDIHVKTKSDEQ
ncbi:MAG: mechanosensitive ion channel [Bacteroidetes bacterium]|nr:mechanosensitive ion channel [Bacteroidota bacterium]